MAVSFLVLFFRFSALNAMTPADREWLSRVGDGGRQRPRHAGTGRANGGQKLMFWALALCMLLLVASGIVMWRAWFDVPVGVIRLGAVVHAATAAVMIALIFVHALCRNLGQGTIRAMWYGTVTRAWAKQHHRAWYRQVTGKS